MTDVEVFGVVADREGARKEHPKNSIHYLFTKTKRKRWRLREDAGYDATLDLDHPSSIGTEGSTSSTESMIPKMRFPSPRNPFSVINSGQTIRFYPKVSRISSPFCT